ncbi:glucans biosynthesis glucosyltransferase MdoH [Dokdonella sp.]|uniref:glucans biosynthesis glucosyltransferase MdoH n=1 Tax=Dokdonella sp. TaxID=2291710 RepID=UPI001B11102A|nr:glucans biosynthesis glucosyltransferase MdoH [Dokdonella sp.]MBO9664446.1 glucans biosynthesis glucosyltransferase MdoH [Dokdonella sp.]
MELRAAAELKRRASAGADVCSRYLARLGLKPGRRESLQQVCAEAGDADNAMARLHAALAEDAAIDANPAQASLNARLQLAGAFEGPAAVVADDPRRGLRLLSAPPLHRASMTPGLWPPPGLIRLPSWLRRRRAPTSPRDDGEVPPPADWQRAATVRRVLLLGMVLAQSYFATSAMVGVLPYHGTKPMEMAVLVLFAILIGWVSAGFWTALAGFVLLVRGHDRYAISARHLAGAPLPPEARTAIVMPICNEDVARVFAGLRATCASLAQTGEIERFDFFVLSDSSDADIRVAEREAWLDLQASLPTGRVYYRRRQHRIKRKSGNVADFCRRWGRDYRYMVVLDADSVMSGNCLVELVRLMEANPNAGIVQTAPRAAGRETLYSRIQQFATRVYGPLFVTGLHFWQLGESHYWGHNAIIRVAPFMRHCALGRLPGGGEILSHDFVEAALMRRAGWAVWIAYELSGSYEEMPPNLLDELKRDRRWCQGNLINSRLFFAQGLHPAHRAVFVTGVMAYLSAPLWFGFLLLSTVLLAIHTLSEPTYFTAPNQLFPLWPEWHPARAIGLFGATATLLFLPKILSVALIALKDAKPFGGTLRLAASVLLEIVFSAWLAPIRMLFHTKFIGAALVGWAVHWKSPPRDDAQTTWREACVRHGGQTVLGLAWLGLVYWLNPAYLWWLLPVAGAMALSIPISVYSSRVTLGRRARSARLFLIPEESHPPRVLRRMRRYLQHAASTPRFVDAVVDPLRNAIACAADVARTEHSEAVQRAHAEVVARALRDGPAALDENDRNALLRDAQALSRLHFSVWSSPEAHPDWLEAPLAPPPRRKARGETARP